jgi:hypothetical protein
MGVYLASIHYLIQTFHMAFPQSPILLPEVDQRSKDKNQICSSALKRTIIFGRGLLHFLYCALYGGMIT